MLTQIHHKKNELQEVKFFEDAECTVPFDFTEKENLYIDLKYGDCTLIFCLPTDISVFIPYIPNLGELQGLCESKNIGLQTLDDITPNLSKYISESNEVIFLNQKDFKKCDFPHKQWINSVEDLLCEDISGIVTIFLPHGTQSELQKANEVAKELKEKYGVEEVNFVVLHCFVKYSPLKSNEYYINDDGQYIKYSFDNFITTNSTGILPVQDKERLQVIDCKEIFEEYLK